MMKVITLPIKIKNISQYILRLTLCLGIDLFSQIISDGSGATFKDSILQP